MREKKLQKHFVSFCLATLLPSFGIAVDINSSTESSPISSGDTSYTDSDLVGNIWASSGANINLVFKNHTWSMDTSGIQINNSTNIIIHTSITPQTSGTTPTLKLRQDTGSSFSALELINTGAKVMLWQKGGWGGNIKLADTFSLRGTSLETFWGNANSTKGSPDGLHGNSTNGIKLVFAKGSKLDTTLTENQTTLKITDKAVDQNHTGAYDNGVYDGNYIAESYGKIKKIVTDGSFDIAYIGESSHNSNMWTGGGKFGKDSKLTLINASNDGGFDASKIGVFFKDNTSANAKADIFIEGTNITNGDNIVQRTSNQDKLNFYITFVKEDFNMTADNSSPYVGDVINDFSTTNASGALKDSILKVAESKLIGGIDFKNANAYVTFVGGSQTLSSANILKNGSASSIYTFRASDLDLGDTTSSIQGVRGTIAFDLSHGNESIRFGSSFASNTARNMFASNSSGKYQTIYNLNEEKLTINRLVFADPTQLSSLSTLTTLKNSGNYFGDSEVFGTLGNEERAKEYAKIGAMKELDSSKNSRLITLYNLTFELNGSGQEIIFVGDKSHRFANNLGKQDNHRLGNSSDSMLTFIDAGTIFRDRIMNLSNGTQQGKGTINLIGNTQIGLKTEGNKQVLTLADGNEKGEGLTLNAIYTGENPLGAGGTIQADIDPALTTPTQGHQASSANIGVADEKTIYHILFDYTSSNLTFGEHQAYTGTITGLTTASKIKFKNAGYIWKNQIASTQAEIILDNTQLREDLRNDNAVLDYRNNKLSIAGSILTSDTNDAILSQKILTFDFTGTTDLGRQFRDSYKIQAGRKVAPNYTSEADSILTFQNAPTLMLDGSRAGTQSILQALANATGFRAFGGADKDGADFAQNHATKSYILEGADLVFEGTSLKGNVVENYYDLKLTFDSNPTNQTALKENIQSSNIQGSITMGANRILDLTLKNQNSIQGDKLTLNLGSNDTLRLTTTGTNVGTIILNQSQILNATSSINIQEASASLIGIFDTTNDTATTSNIGSFNASFGNGTQAYGYLKHKGALTLSLTGDALFTQEEAKALGFSTDSRQFADLVIDLTTPSTLNLTLHHTSGIVGLVGREVGENGFVSGKFTNFDLTSSTGDLAIKGAFDLGARDVTFDANKRLYIAGHTYLKSQNQRTLTLIDVGSTTQESINTYIDPLIGGNGQALNLNLVNFSSNISVKFINNGNWLSANNYRGQWNIRGVNIALDRVFSVQSSDNPINMVFAKGYGREVAYDPATPQTKTSMTLDQLSGEDKINSSSLSGNFATLTWNGSVYHPEGFGSTLMLKNSNLTFIGKDAINIALGNERIDGSYNQGSNLRINLYNSIIQDGSILLDSSMVLVPAYNYWKITDKSQLLGTDTFNLSVSKIPTPPSDSYYGQRFIADNYSTINATFINNGGNSTGDRYIDANQDPYAKNYALSDAGGVLSENILKILYSKAYGNIKLDSTVTANLRFIGENSHSFDGKTAVYSGSDIQSKESGGIYYNSQADTIQSNWKKVNIDSNGIVSVGETSLTQNSNIALATLSGGNANSRFYFDNTSVRLDLIKDTEGSTYIYNSNIIGNISVDNYSGFGNTTIFFNQAFSDNQKLSQTTKDFVDYYQRNGIPIDLSKAHLLKNNYLTDGKLARTDKATNIILIGKKAYEETKDGDEGINLSFLPQLGTSSGYNYTIVSGGILDIEELKDILGSTNTERPNNPTNIMETLFGSSRVHLIDTQIVGRISFAQVGFVNVEKNQRSMWIGGNTQYLIYNFNNGKSNLSTSYLQAYAITNRSEQSHYIFTGIFGRSDLVNSNRTLTLSKNGLRNAINAQLTRSKATIDEFVVGYLGLRGVSVRGDIDENLGTINSSETMHLQGNSVDIVFNSTRNIAYKEWFDENGEHQASFELGYANLVSTGLDDDTKISGYSVLKPSVNGGDVSIKGNAHKDIVFIGKDSVEGGFSHLKILEGSEKSSYTFHSVGTLDSTFLQNVSLQKTSTNTQANLGVFRFYNSSIVGDIDIDKNSSDSSNEAKLFFEDIKYEGIISGTMIKNLKFAPNSHIIIAGGANNEDIYDFSSVAGGEVYLDFDFKDTSSNTYKTPTLIGLDKGNVSVIGHFNFAMGENTSLDNSTPLYSLAFNDNAKWTMTSTSYIHSLSLNNTTNSFNLDLASAPRMIQRSANSPFRILEVDYLSGNGGQILLGASLDTQNQANSLTDSICSKNTTGNLTLAISTSISNAKFDTKNNPIVLIKAQSSDATISGREEREGLMILSTHLEHQISDNGTDWEEVTDQNFDSTKNQRWVLSSLSTKENTELVSANTALISNPYRMLITESNNLNKRMGDLRNNPYTQGSWIRIFNGNDIGEGLTNLYTNIQLGYDYGYEVLGGKDYLGVALSTSTIDLSAQSYKGDANTYSIALYDSYITDFGFYVDSIFKYIYTSQKLTPDFGDKTSFGNHALSLGLEVGYQAYIPKTFFYLEPQIEAIYGYIHGVQDIDLGFVGSKQILGELKSTHSLYLRAGGVMGYTFKTQGKFSADLRVGASFVSEQISNSNPINFNDNSSFISQNISNDIKALISIATNLNVSDQWRIYLEAEKTFGGKRNTEYQANIGARFSFGESSKGEKK